MLDKNELTQMLTDYRSYRYAALNGRSHAPEVNFAKLPIYSERMYHPDAWDSSRYNRIVIMIDGAVSDVLSDDQRTVIMRKYMDRNGSTLNEIADTLNKDRSTVSRWHTEALRKLAVALEPLSNREKEITNFDHMFIKDWKHQDTA